MKKRPIIVAGCAALMLALNVSVRAEPDVVRVGDTRVQVEQALGEPRGYLAYGSTEVLMYERGRVELKDEQVVSVQLISVAELERREEERARQRVAEQERQALLFAEGTALRDRKMEDAVFASAPSSERVAYWRAFRAKYPAVNIAEPYTIALRELEIELASQVREADTQSQIAALERRVGDAEARARAAEDEARRSRSTSYYVGYAGYPVGRTYYYGHPAKYRSAYYGNTRGRAAACKTYPSTSYYQRHTPGVVYPSSRGSSRCTTPSYRSSHITARVSF